MTGKELKRLRKRLGLTQKQLAAKVGVAVNTIKRWECGLKWRPGARPRPIPEPIVRLLAYLALGEAGNPNKIN